MNSGYELAQQSVRKSLFVIAVAFLSLGITFLYLSHPAEAAVATGAIALFLLLVWDLRLLLPMVLILGPLGPKFPLSFGNFYLTTGILLIAYLAWVWRGSIIRSSFILIRNPVGDALILMLAAMLCSFINFPQMVLRSGADALRIVQFVMYSGIFLLTLHMEFTRSQIKKLLFLALLVGVVEALIGCYQWIVHPGIFVTGTFDFRHTNFSVYMTYMMFVFLGIVLEAESLKWILPALIALGLSLYSIVFSFTRSAYVAILIGLIVVMLIPFKLKRRILLLLIVVAAGTLLLGFLPRDVVARAMSTYRVVLGIQRDISFSGRLKLWAGAFSRFRESPVFGTGIGTYGLADNFYMKTIAETGAAGLVTFLLVIYSLLREQWRIFQAGIEDTLVRSVAKGLFPATVATIIVMNASGDQFMLHRFMGVYWIVLSLVMKWTRGSETD